MDNSKVIVVGVGSCGSNMVNSFIDSSEMPYHTMIASTAADVLEYSLADETLSLIVQGITPAKGLKGSVELGKKTGEHFSADFLQRVAPFETVVFLAGLGGGTGTGVTSVFARKAIEAGKNVLCIAVLPFQFEGKERKTNATAGLAEMQNAGAWVITFDNQGLFKLADDKTTFADAFRMADKEILNIFKNCAAQDFNSHHANNRLLIATGG
jgi:cell division protein FtsZ